jgi:CRP-like cAMP-binding protein
VDLNHAVRSHGLTGRDAAAFASLFTLRGSLARSEFLWDEGDATRRLSIVTEGFAHATRLLSQGRQQSLALFLPGDFLDLPAFVLGSTSVSVCALSHTAIAQANKAQVQALIAERPAVGHALWRATARSAAATEEWLVGLGRRSAFERLAHLVCEVVHRMRRADLVSQAGCAFPLTQTQLADMLGLSAVHVNRILQQLRSEGLIELRNGRLTVRDEARLIRAGDFRPDYLAPSSAVLEAGA